MIDKEAELKIAVQAVCERMDVKGHLLLYMMDGNRIKFTGDLPLSALAPLLTELIAKRFRG